MLTCYAVIGKNKTGSIRTRTTATASNENEVKPTQINMGNIDSTEIMNENDYKRQQEHTKDGKVEDETEQLMRRPTLLQVVVFLKDKGVVGS